MERTIVGCLAVMNKGKEGTSPNQIREFRNAARDRARNEKPGATCRPGSWRSFDEYVLLEDSRYTSQAKN
jgi:hypothetical protein